jgi:hypothetical protein
MLKTPQVHKSLWALAAETLTFFRLLNYSQA